jgi:hypothetical protein
VSVHTLPEDEALEVVVSNSIRLAVECRRQAVRTAVQQIVDDTPHLALATLIRSVRRCAHLDNRPLSAERVFARAAQVEQMVGEAA